MGRVFWALSAVSLLLAAGCAEPGVTTSGDDAAFDDFDVDVDENTGAIRGIVVDQTITPIDGVLITIGATGLTATTNFEGAFAVGGLEPGTYFLTATKLGFQQVQQSVEVVAGVKEPPVVKLRMDADPTQLPYFDVDQFDGYIVCSTRLGIIGYATCSGMEDDECCKDFDSEIGDFAGLHVIQSEAVWESTQELGDEMGWSITCMNGPQCPNGQIIIGEERKNSPLLVQINATAVDHFFTGENDIDLRMFADGYTATDVREEDVWELLGQCVEWPILFEACVRYNGIGVILEQEFTGFTHIFYNGLEPPEEWRFTEDGHPPRGT